MKDMQQTHSDFVLLESTSDTIAGVPAWRSVYMDTGYKSLLLTTIRMNKVYSVLYRSQPEKYTKFLPIVKEMINSFKFLG